MPVGWLWTILLNGALGWAAYWAAGHGFRQRGLAAGMAAATLAWAWLTVGMQLLGSIGSLNQGALLLWVLGALVMASAARWVWPCDSSPVAEGFPRWDLPAFVALGLVFLIVLVVGMPSLLLPAKVVSDGPIYHLYFAARWWKAGRVFLVASPFGETAATYFPAGGDLWFAWLMTGWGGDRLARIGQVPFLLLAGFAAYGLARRMGVGGSAAWLAASWFLTSLPLVLFSFEANVDTIFVAGYLVSCYFGLEYLCGERRVADLLLAGLAAGCAWGTKPTAMVFVLPLVALGTVGVLTGPISRTKRVGHVLGLITAAAIPVGFWIGRLIWLTGNPLYPLQLSVFGHVIAAGWYDSSAMRQSQYYLDVRDWRALVDILSIVFDPRELPCWIGACAGLWAVRRNRTSHDRWIWLCAGLALLNIGLYWLLIPYRTQQRFMLQALGLATVPLAALFDRGAPMRWAGLALLALHLVTPQSWPAAAGHERPPWDLSDKIPHATQTAIIVPLNDARALLSGSWDRFAAYRVTTFVICAVGSFVIAWGWRRAGSRAQPRSWIPAIGLTIFAIAIVAASFEFGMFALQGVRATDIVFPNFPDYARGWLQLESRCPPEGARIAYAGTNLPYYLMCKDLRNDVEYVPNDSHRTWLMHDYHRQAVRAGQSPWPSPRPGWDRIQPDYEAWLSNLRAAGVRILVVARVNPVEGPFNVADSERFPIERVWAETNPESFEPLYGVAPPDPLFKFYLVRPEREPIRNSSTELPSSRH